MIVRAARTLWVLPVLVLFAQSALADREQAQGLLQAMAKAYHELDYRGRIIYAHGADISTMEVSHAVIDGREYERLTHLDGQLAELIRHGNQLICIHPDQTVTRLPTQSGLGPLSVRDRLARVPAQYNVLLDGEGRVAGRAALRMRLSPLDNHRHGYRLWLDRASSLLLKSETVDESGRVLERVEFVMLDLSPGLDKADFAPPQALEERVLMSVEDTAAAGPLPRVSWLPGGFVASPADLRQPGVERRQISRPVAARTWSDGLAAFSIFVEDVPPDGDREEGVSRHGPTVAVTRQLKHDGRDYRLTLIGEVPLETAERIASGMGLEGADHD